jgi:hypothetical protein
VLIVYHTGGVKTAQMAAAVERVARGEETCNVSVKRLPEPGRQDVLAADALILGNARELRLHVGMMKDFLERVFLRLRGQVNGRPERFSSAPGRTQRAVTSVEEIVTGLEAGKKSNRISD